MTTKAPSEKIPVPPKIRVPATAVVLGSVLSGAMMSLSAFAVRVFLETNDDPHQLLRQWVRLYHYGHIYMPAVCLFTFGLYGYAALAEKFKNRERWSYYVLAAVATITMVPFTWLVMVPTNNLLFLYEESESVEDSILVQALVVKWAWMHVARSFFPLLGAFLGFTGLLDEICWTF